MVTNDPYDTFTIGEDGRSQSPLALPNTGDFMHIVPQDLIAQLAFDQVALRFKADPIWQLHASRFMFIHEEKILVDIPMDTSDPTDVSDDSIARRATPRAIWHGHYCLNPSISPSDPRRGWTMGSGRVRSGKSPDLLLSVSRRQDKVRGMHALFYYHLDTRDLMIRAFEGKSISVNGEIVNHIGRILPSGPVGIKIGHLLYTIKYPEYNKAQYLAMRDKLMSWIPRSLSDTLESTPGDSRFLLHGYEVESPTAYGAYGVLSRCKSKDGTCFAMKRVQRTEQNAAAIAVEINVMKRIGVHHNVCSVVEVFYSDGDENDMSGSKINDVHMILAPWATTTAESLFRSPEKSIAGCIAQVIQGLHHLHNLGFIHRDIKPTNILYIPETQHFLVADFGHVLRMPDGEPRELDVAGLTDHRKGTKAYLPPEIVALKYMEKGIEVPTFKRLGADGDKPIAQWSRSSDIFSAGLMFVQLLVGEWRFERKDTASKLSGRKLKGLLLSMIVENPARRPSTDIILANVDLKNLTDGPLSKRKAAS